MGYLQRVILVLLACMVLVSPAVIRYRRHQYFVATLADTYACCYFEELCTEGNCSEEGYRSFCEYMQILGNASEVYLEEYQRVFRQDGTEYRSYISWDEITDVIQKEGVYHFAAGSELRLYAGTRVYYGMVRNGE